jgi:D-tyrosyl-tRNA(Tyr) deacylase
MPFSIPHGWRSLSDGFLVILLVIVCPQPDQEKWSSVKVLLQRVSRAEVRVDGAVAGKIGGGLLILLGIEQGDREADVDYYAAKTADLRIFPDSAASMNRSLVDTGGAALVISQFTLASDTRRGRRPSFSRAAPPAEAERLYAYFVKQLRTRIPEVATGLFQAMMDVELVNDGPVTILLDPPGTPHADPATP